MTDKMTPDSLRDAIHQVAGQANAPYTPPHLMQEGVVSRHFPGHISRIYYKNAKADAGTIAQEVISTGKSDGWSALTDAYLKVAKEIEQILAKFNIGCVDDARGTWRYVKGGSKLFQKEA